VALWKEENALGTTIGLEYELFVRALFQLTNANMEVMSLVPGTLLPRICARAQCRVRVFVCTRRTLPCKFGPRARAAGMLGFGTPAPGLPAPARPARRA